MAGVLSTRNLIPGAIAHRPQPLRQSSSLIDLSEKYHVAWNMLSQNLAWDDVFIGGRCSMVTNSDLGGSVVRESMPPDRGGNCADLPVASSEHIPP